MRKFNFVSAFSLIELMISLIVISSISAAFAPVISKRLSSTATTISSGQGSISTKCEDKFGADCTLCYKTKCIICLKSCTSNTYVDIPTCTCKSCSSIATNCTKCNDEKCLQCNLGYKLVNGKCEKCPAGYSCNGITQTICSAGTYSGAGAASCTACQAGKYQASKGKSYCDTCPAGKYSAAGASSCSTCQAGKYSSAGAGSCSTCPAGKYSAAGAGSCSTCQAGKYSSAGASSCSTCEAGKYSAAGAGSCTPCSEGKYQPNSGKSSCIVCPAGKYQPNTGQTACIACPRGQYQKYTGKTSCDPCGSGKTTLNTGSTSSSSCINCPSNCTNCDGTTCKECASGYVVQNGSTCVSAFPGKDFTSSTTWTVPAGLTKINVTLVGGGYKGGTGASVTGTTKTYTSNDSISLTGNYAALKGKTITIKLCGAGGKNAANASYSSYKPGEDPKWIGKAGNGAAGGSGQCVKQISSTATSLTINVGVAGGANGASNPQWCSIFNRCNKGCKNTNCHSNDYQKPKAGGAGGAASTVSDGSFTVTAGGGGGGGAANTCNQGSSEKERYGLWTKGGNGGQGGGGAFGGAGGNGATYRGKYNHDGGNGSPGTTNCQDNTFSYTNKCGVGQDGIVIINFPTASIKGNGGNSGKCWTKTGIAVTPGTKCTIHIGGSSGGESYIQCGSAKYSSNSGTKQNVASGSTGGAGYSAGCDPGTYGKGGDGSTSSTANNGKSGYIRIENGNT